MLLSIITVNLNNWVGLLKTINSIESQSFNDFEYIVIDGGSVDKSMEVINQKSNLINYFCSEADNGIYHAMNKGIEKANGSYLLFLNSGDYLISDSILQQIFDLKLQFDLLYGDIMVIKDNSLIMGSMLPEELTMDYIFSSTLMHPATFIKAELLKKTNGYKIDYKIAGDYRFFLEAIFCLNASYKRLPFPISVFDLEGLSSKKEYGQEIMNERKRAIQEIFHPILVNHFEEYRKLKVEKTTFSKSIIGKIFNKISKLHFLQ